MIIAIDGPAGSGKSTVSKMIAQKLGILYVDTGAMYRALTLKAIVCGIKFDDKKSIIEMTKTTDIRLIYRDGDLQVLLDGRDISREIRTPKVTNNIKFVASIPQVRKEMVKMQRRVAKDPKGAVLEGRDIGTVVFPDADRKFYLDADFKIRVQRRYKELIESGEDVNLSEVEKDVKIRDKSDMEREIAPLKKADDAIVIDTTNLTIEETVEKILRYL